MAAAVVVVKVTGAAESDWDALGTGGGCPGKEY